MLRAGLIGLGVMGKNHARILSELSGVEFVAIYDHLDFSVSEKLDKLRCSSLSEFFQRNLDYCVVASPTHTHEKIAHELAKNGVHALIEKPLSDCYESALRIQQLYQSKELIGGVGHIERYNAAIVEAKKRISKGLLGEIYQISTSRFNPYSQRTKDIGVARDLASHDIDTTMWLTNSNYAWLKGTVKNLGKSEFEDLVCLIGETESSVVVNHIVNWISPYKERRTVILGENGTFICDTITSSLTFYKNSGYRSNWDELVKFHGISTGEVITFAIEKVEPLRLEHEHFRDAVLTGKSNIVTLTEGAEVVRVTDLVLT